MQDLNEAGETRCWVFGSSKPISAGDPVLVGRLNRFFSQWQSHGESVSGRWRILYERFLVVLREPEGAEVSGCSIDSMIGEVKQLETELGTSLLDSSRIFFRTESGKVESVGRQEFKALAATGRITRDTEVFDTTLTRLSDLEVGIFSKQVRESWHLRLLEQALKQTAAALPG
jgi:hypothetical protein